MDFRGGGGEKRKHLFLFLSLRNNNNKNEPREKNNSLPKSQIPLGFSGDQLNLSSYLFQGLHPTLF